MHVIAHRINTIRDLKNLPREFGVEVDVRDEGQNLILQHDPFKTGESFEEYLKNYCHGTMIVNVKSERIEDRILELLHAYNIEDFFFLDSSFPMIMRLIQRGENRVALRYSEYESVESIMRLSGKVQWVWVDGFQKLTLTSKESDILREAGFRLCLVSPELQGRDADIEMYQDKIKDQQLCLQAVCTKTHNIPRWQIKC
ncbi:MAG: hypothetical protein KC713_05130 [Candidatus Omnitrophica bacterium]|nr:hypothetical protein [Candidatus Omnitrophota bacterium]